MYLQVFYDHYESYNPNEGEGYDIHIFDGFFHIWFSHMIQFYTNPSAHWIVMFYDDLEALNKAKSSPRRQPSRRVRMNVFTE